MFIAKGLDQLRVGAPAEPAELDKHGRRVAL